MGQSLHWIAELLLQVAKEEVDPMPYWRTTPLQKYSIRNYDRQDNLEIKSVWVWYVAALLYNNPYISRPFRQN